MTIKCTSKFDRLKGRKLTNLLTEAEVSRLTDRVVVPAEDQKGLGRSISRAFWKGTILCSR